MSLDNANPTIFQTATVGKRERFNHIFNESYNATSSDTDGSSDDEMGWDYSTGGKGRFLLDPSDDFLVTSTDRLYSKAAEKETQEKVDFIELEEVYSE